MSRSCYAQVLLAVMEIAGYRSSQAEGLPKYGVNRESPGLMMATAAREGMESYHCCSVLNLAWNAMLVLVAAVEAGEESLAAAWSCAEFAGPQGRF